MAAALPGPEWLAQRRQDAATAVTSMAPPSEKEEVWRYSPIDELNLAAYTPAGDAGSVDPACDAFVADLRDELPEGCVLVVWRNGRPWRAPPGRGLPEGLTLSTAVAGPRSGDGDGPLGQVLRGGDLLVRLNDAFMADALVVDVAPGATVEVPLVVVHWCDGAGHDTGAAPASFPRTVVRLGRNAAASVVEVVAGAPGGADALVVPVTELAIAESARLSYVALQVLGTGCWHIARLAADVGRDAHLRSFTVGLGGAYDRTRLDVAVRGQGGSSEVRSVYLGTGDQVHDVRTLQDHAAPRSTSDLLCKGAVAGTSRSVYSGLIRVRRGAVRTNAYQTNHNLVLDERAHADSVPNLDIEENDVRCSHASTVGPVDEDQRYYLESRGIEPDEAERLIVLGFFDDIVEHCPVPAVTHRLRREVGLRLADALGLPEVAR